MTRGPTYGRLAPYYDTIYAFKDYPREARECRSILARYRGRPTRRLLDVACGTGAHLRTFRKWYEVAGVDASPEMLAVARRSLGRGVPLVRADMRAFELGRRFYAIVCLFSAFGHLPTARDRDRAAATFFRHLEPGGVALVEGWVLPERWRRDRRLHVLAVQRDDLAIARITRTSARRGISRLEMIYTVLTPRGPARRYRDVFRMPLVPAAGIRRSFERAGFEVRVLRHGRYRDRGLYVARRPVGDAR